jgi:hypothetical protein
MIPRDTETKRSAVPLLLLVSHFPASQFLEGFLAAGQGFQFVDLMFAGQRAE